MGLFDPPAVKIRSRLPKYALTGYDEMVRLAEERTPSDLSKSDRKLFVAFLAAAWVASENRLGQLGLGPINGEYIQSILEKCHKQLGANGEVALSVVQQMHNEGILALPPAAVL